MISRTLGVALAAVAAAIGAAACCAPPFLIGLLGLSSAGLGGALEPYRPVFLATSAGTFGLGFLWVQRRSAGHCDDEGCRDCRRATLAKGILITALSLSALVAFYPSWRTWF